VKLRFARPVALALAALLTTSSAWSQVTEMEFLVAARAIGFIDSLRPGALNVGVVYAPGNAQSEQQARELAAFMADGRRVGNFVMQPVLLPIDQVSTRNIGLFFLTQGVGNEARKVASASRSRKIPCITYDLIQVRAGNCTMGVRTEPRIEVLVNGAAAAASGTDLAAVFRMMITEI